jgi:anti-sigma factor RsiW
MTCRELTDFVLDYLADDLPAPLRQAFDRHLDLCPNCRVYLATYDATITAERLAFGDELAAQPPLPEDLVQAILAAREPGR